MGRLERSDQPNTTDLPNAIHRKRFSQSRFGSRTLWRSDRLARGRQGPSGPFPLHSRDGLWWQDFIRDLYDPHNCTYVGDENFPAGFLRICFGSDANDYSSRVSYNSLRHGIAWIPHSGESREAMDD